MALSRKLLPHHSATSLSLVGKCLDGRYQVCDRLSQGGFGKTYIAADMRRPGHPPCVVKHLQPLNIHTADDLDDARLRFHQEAEILETLGHHDQIPRLLAHFEEEGEFYLVQEFIEGRSLQAEFNFHPIWTKSQAVEFLQEILTVLNFVHQHNIIHRDIKPDNIIRRQSDNRLVLIDFGSVKQVQTRDVGSDIGCLTVAIRSEGYTPIEQLSGQPCPSSDIYTVGIVALQALTGEHPRDLEALIHADHAGWGDRLPVDARLLDILRKMTQRDWQTRYLNTSEVLQDLQRLADAQSSAPESTASTDWPAPGPSSGYTPTQVAKPIQPQEISVPTLKIAPANRPVSSSPSPLEWKVPTESVAPAPSPVSLKKATAQLKQTAQSRLKKIGIYRSSQAIALLVGFSMISTGVIVGLSLFFGFSPSQRKEQTAVFEPLPVKFLQQTLKGSAAIEAIALSRDGRTLFTGTTDQSIDVWDLTQGQLIQSLTDHFDSITTVAISAGTDLIASGSADSKIKLWNLHTGELLHTLRGHQWSVLSVAFSPDGQILASSGQDNVIHLWDATTGELRRTLSAFKSPALSLDISPDGAWLVAGSADNTVQVWNLHTGELVNTLRGHSGPVHAVSISSNSAVLVTGSADSTLGVWNLQTGQRLHTLDGHWDEVRAIALSPDGRTLASSGADGTIKLWNLYTGSLLHTYSNFESESRALAIHPDRQTLMSAHLNGTIKIWQLPQEVN